MQDLKDEIGFDDFLKLDIRVGTIIAVEEFPRARNPSWKLQVDLGPLGTRWSSAQVTNYSQEQLLGSQVLCVVNFAPRNIAGFMSEVLVLGLRDESGDIILVSPRSPVPEGEFLQ